MGHLFTQVRNLGESAMSLAGNYFLPGSSLLTSHLVSQGSQKQLGSPLGEAAQLLSVGAGASTGNFSNYGNLLNAATGTAGSAAATSAAAASGSMPVIPASNAFSNFLGASLVSPDVIAPSVAGAATVASSPSLLTAGENLLSTYGSKAIMPLALAGTALYAKHQSIPGLGTIQGQENQLNTFGTSQLDAGQTGQATAPQQAEINQWVQQQKEAINQQLANAGITDSSVRNQYYAQIEQQALGMQANFAQQAITNGLNALGGANSEALQAAQMQMMQNESLSSSLSQAMGDYFGMLGMKNG